MLENLKTRQLGDSPFNRFKVQSLKLKGFFSLPLLRSSFPPSFFPVGRALVLGLLFCFLSFLFPVPQPAFAHIAKDSTPDPVAKMEYLILLDFQPDNIDVRNKLAMVFLRLKELPEAAEQFKEVLRRDPANFNAIDGMGLVFSAQNKYSEALARFEKAITMNPRDAMVYYHRGRVFEALDRFREAVAGYEKALTLFPENPAIKLNKQKKEVDKALQDLRARMPAGASGKL